MSRQARSRGNMLVEAMLAIAIVGFLMTAVLPMIQTAQIEQSARSTADDFASFQTAAAQHFIANRSAYEAAATDGTGADKLCKVGVDPNTGAGGTQANSTTKKTCALDTAMLMYLGALPKSMRTTNRYGESWVAIYRMVYDTAATPAPTGAVDMLTVSAAVTGTPAAVTPDEVRHREIVTGAALQGGSGGFVPDADRAVCTASRAQSKYEVCGAGWKVNLADFVDTPQVTAFGGRLAQ